MKRSAPSLRAAVLISGGGTNLQAFIDARDAGELDLELSLVISNRPQAYGLVRAQRAGIDTACISHTGFADRETFDAAVAAKLDEYKVNLVLLAGFMRILSPAFVSRFAGRLLNIHPSLLPRFPGLDTHRRAIAAGDQWHGSTVHFVSDELDGGPRIIQGRVRVLPDDDTDSLAGRVLAVEHRIYPEAVSLIVDGRIRYADGTAWLDGKKIDEPLQFRS